MSLYFCYLWDLWFNNNDDEVHRDCLYEYLVNQLRIELDELKGL
jgi:hypothetical protein